MSEQLYAIIFKAQHVDSINGTGIYNCYVEHTTVMENGRFARYRGVDTCYFDPTTLSDGYWFTREHHPVTEGAIAKETRVHFTENEIKEIDERYWQFAAPVEKSSSILEALKSIRNTR